MLGVQQSISALYTPQMLKVKNRDMAFNRRSSNKKFDLNCNKILAENDRNSLRK